MDNQLFEFPFKAEVWGTVSDWVMVLVTATTAWLLLRTLNEQKKFTKIELERYARENPPTFASRNDLGNSRNPPNPLKFRVILKNNGLKNLVISNDFPVGFEITHDYSNSESLIPDSQVYLTISNKTSPELKDCNGKIKFEYDDMLNNRYIQVLELKRANSLSWKPPYKISNS
ncbi:hypothetical protein [Cyclobacterium plantarum]|uniref:hypothetical protein n=1 Tax=Cyclobacterium plantarum TaxID=2716263 RepID=UPI003F707674